MSYLEKAVEISTQLENYEGDNWTDLINLCGEADQRITELEAENKRLKDVQNSLCEIIEQYEKEYGVFDEDGFTELQAENKRLKELCDGAKPVVELYTAFGGAAKQWKKYWLDTCKELLESEE